MLIGVCVVWLKISSMEEDCKCLRFNWRQYTVIIQVDPDRCNMLYLVIYFEDEGKKSVLDYKYLAFSYVHNTTRKSYSHNIY